MGPGARTGDHATLRRVVAESWRRSRGFALDPDAVPGVVDVADDELRAYRAEHPLVAARPIIDRLLVQHAADAGLIVAIGDQSGRLLWVDGDRRLRRRAEAIAFQEGADWSERAAGTSAPGTALALGRAVQIRGEEHFARMVHPWSCSAVPLRDRATGALLGVLDVTGGEEAVAPVTLPLLEATAAAVEAELALVARGRASIPSLVPAAPRLHVAGPASTRRTPQAAPPVLSILGRDDGVLRSSSGEVVLSQRHAEILTVLADRPEGLSATELADAVYGRDDAVVTLRAEMVRLRRALRNVAPQLGPLARPYRLGGRLDVDAHQVLAFLERGAHRIALAAYTGPVLPASEAPGPAHLRDVVRSQLRESLLAGASVDTLLAFARTSDGADDVEVWLECLRLLPPRSPRRAAVVARLEELDAALTTPARRDEPRQARQTGAGQPRRLRG
ncbi:GAF domain-containing protein [Flavimobilis soli]|uniref:GAF domain-containing protein n=1 Tax=Flavimobilis soli TaxID=442709 RepID=UPI0014733860|nr:GAF domain-containing protein [Flavimobilis soli]